MGVSLGPKIGIFEKFDFFGLWPASSEVKNTPPAAQRSICVYRQRLQKISQQSEQLSIGRDFI